VFFCLLLGVLSLCHRSQAETGLLYSTNFDSFPIGENQWAGSDGWFSNQEATTGGIQGIDNNITPGIGQSAFLGAAEPTTTWNFVARSINHDPAAENSAFVEIETLVGFEDSTNEQYDSFFVGVYNMADMAGDFLAAVQFSNEREAFGIFWDNGTTVQDTTVDYIHGELQLLNITIDLPNNLWSADFDGIPLFRDEIFTTTGRTRNFGLVSYEWQTTSSNPANHGNNWMLIADCAIWAIPPGAEQIDLTNVAISPGDASFEFLGEPGWTYQVEYAGSLDKWLSDLPESSFSVTGSTEAIKFSDQTSELPSTRFYRVIRTVSP